MSANIEVQLNFGEENEWNKEKLREFILENNIIFQETPKFHKHMMANIKIKGIHDLIQTFQKQSSFQFPGNTVEEDKMLKLLMKMSANPESISNSQTTELLKFFSKDISSLIKDKSKQEEEEFESSVIEENKVLTEKKNSRHASVLNIGNEYLKDKFNTQTVSKPSGGQKLRNSMIEFPSTNLSQELLKQRHTLDPKDSRTRVSQLKDSLINNMKNDTLNEYKSHKQNESFERMKKNLSKSPGKRSSVQMSGQSQKTEKKRGSMIVENSPRQVKATHRHTLSASIHPNLIRESGADIFKVENAKRKIQNDQELEKENLEIERIKRMLENNMIEEDDEVDYYDPNSLNRRSLTGEKVSGNMGVSRISQRGSMIEKSINFGNLSRPSQRLSIAAFMSMSPPPKEIKRVVVNKKAKMLLDEMKNNDFNKDLNDIAKTLKDRKVDNSHFDNLQTKIDRKDKSSIDPKLFFIPNSKNKCIKEDEDRKKLINILQRHLLKLFIRMQDPESCLTAHHVAPVIKDCKERIELLGTSELISYYELINKKATGPFFRFAKKRQRMNK